MNLGIALDPADPWGFFNEIFDYGFIKKYEGDLKRWFKDYYYHRYFQFMSALPYPITYPIIGYGTLNLMISSDIELDIPIRMHINKRQKQPKLKINL